jgi:hypothetical protein
MSRDYITIGSTPPNEDCAQVGAPDYHERMRKETRAYIAQLRRELGEEPPGAHLCVKGFPHDFETYHEVCCSYDTEDEEAADYAFRCESDGPAEWDRIARQELGLMPVS